MWSQVLIRSVQLNSDGCGTIDQLVQMFKNQTLVMSLVEKTMIISKNVVLDNI